MTPRLSSFGCSFTWGTELDDQSNNHLDGSSQITWPALIAKAIDMPYCCRAIGGCGNLAIANRAGFWADTFSYDLMIINWTFIDRFDYRDPTELQFNDDGLGFLTCRPSNNDEISDFYFRHLHSEYRDKLTALMYIKTTIDHLRSKQVRFVMTAIDDLLWCQQWHAPALIRYLQQEIRPYIHDFEGRNFLAWAKHRGFQISSNNHPLEEAHAAAAELMLPVVQKLLKI